MKRFYTDVSLAPVDDGFEVHLDERAVKTPTTVNLIVPTEALAEAVADEWRAQQDFIVPDSMPMTRLANTAMDRVAETPENIADEIAAYAGNDLVCYRAEVPPELIAAQTDAWDMYIQWAEERFGARPEITSGIVHINQPEVFLVAISAALAEIDVYRLAALHNLTSLSGSALIALFLAEVSLAEGALAEDVVTAENAWDAARVDEAFQQSHWGIDDEAATKSANDKTMFMAAAHFLVLLSV